MKSTPRRTSWLSPLPPLLGILALGLVAPAGALAQTTPAPLSDAWFFPDRPATLKVTEGKTPPELKLKNWIGDKVSVPESRGKVVVIDFWATWCGPCMAAVPHNVEMVKKYKDKGLVFLGVHDANSGWDSAQSVVTEKQINYPVARDEDGGLSAKAFGLAFWPTYIAIDRAGIVRGVGLTPNGVEEAVKVLLAEPAPAGLDAKGPSNGLPAEWFYGGEGRGKALKAAEGKPLPELGMREWVGTPLSAADTKDRVVVFHFMATGNPLSMRQAEALGALEKEMGPQGVVVVAVCAADDAWDAVKKLAEEGKVPSRICQDSEATGEKVPGSAGATATILGVRRLPTTIVVDRRGVVRAAGVRVEKVKEVASKLLAESSKGEGDKTKAPGEASSK